MELNLVVNLEGKRRAVLSLEYKKETCKKKYLKLVKKYFLSSYYSNK